MRRLVIFPRLTASETAIAVSGALWGLYWIPVRHLDARGVGAVWITLGLFVVGLALLVPVLLRHRPARAALTPRMFATGLLTGGSFVLYSVSLVLTEVAAAILLFYLSPVWATVLGRLLLAERFTGSRLAALGLGLGGLWVVLGGEGGVPLPRGSGDWCALIAGAMWALGSLRVHQDATVSPVAHTTSFFAGGATVIAVISLLPVMSGPAPVVTPEAAAIVVVVAVVTIASMGGILWGVRLLSPGRAGLLLMLEVITGLVSAAVLAGEPFGIARIIGSVLIVGAALVEVLPSTGPRRA
ncbi:MAG: DMT family transporter [Thiotrichales bacterium]|nr:DMT family transporter [Thiotrichales bacterium]